jgi:hypothetical protein
MKNKQGSRKLDRVGEIIEECIASYHTFKLASILPN